ncbi:hypothetical protein ACTFIT_008135 [Dictyostelium discoideum]
MLTEEILSFQQQPTEINLSLMDCIKKYLFTNADTDLCVLFISMCKIYQEMSVFIIDLKCHQLYILTNFKIDTEKYISETWVTNNNLSYSTINKLINEYDLVIGKSLLQPGLNPEIIAFQTMKTILFPNNKTKKLKYYMNNLTKAIKHLIDEYLNKEE